MRGPEQQIKRRDRISHTIMSMRDRQQAESEPFRQAPGWLWNEAAGKLVLRVPKSENPPAKLPAKPPSPGATIIDRVLAGKTVIG